MTTNASESQELNAVKGAPVRGPLVSVIIPTFDRSEMVCEAIQSVFKQTYRHVELIVIDDGSRDLTEAVVKECFENKDPELAAQYYRLPNSGVSRARNFGIGVSKGEIIAFLDSDDLWGPNKLARQVRYFDEHPGARIVHTDEVWIRNGEHLNQKKIHTKLGGRIFQHCLPLCIISPSSVAIRRSALQEVGCFDESLPVCEDYDLWLRMAAAFEIDYIPEKLITKRGGHEDQLSKSYWGMDRFRVLALRKAIRDKRLSADDRKLALEELKKKCHILSSGSFKRGRRLSGLYYRLLPHVTGLRMAIGQWH